MPERKILTLETKVIFFKDIWVDYNDCFVMHFDNPDFEEILDGNSFAMNNIPLEDIIEDGIYEAILTVNVFEDFEGHFGFALKNIQLKEEF